MTQRGWGWSVRDAGALRGHDIAWLRPFVAAAPWLTLCMLVVTLYLLGGTLSIAEGVLFDLPEREFADGEQTSLVALLLPTSRETLVFFDDARFLLGDDQSMEAFREQLGERAAKLKEDALLVLADRRISAGELMNFAATARAGGIKRILFAQRHHDET